MDDSEVLHEDDAVTVRLCRVVDPVSSPRPTFEDGEPLSGWRPRPRQVSGSGWVVLICGALVAAAAVYTLIAVRP